MITITIVGWYGTETIGDRAILAGLINTFSKVYPEFSIRLGSLYPDFSKRVLIEDLNFLKEIALGNLREVSIFDSMNKKELKRNVLESQLVAIGGGPLMDLTEMHMLRFALRFAKEKGIKTAILGCGWGPLKQQEYIDCAIDMAYLADIVIFRDEISRNRCRELLPGTNAVAAIDPAFFCAMFFKSHCSEPSCDHISVNFRDVALDQYDVNVSRSEEILLQIVSRLLEETELPIHLVPMHSFVIGGDDRDILNRIALRLNSPRITVLNNPPSLPEVMADYFNAALCIGMRFHAILLQTALNGKNFIFDYTNPTTGKTIGLLHQLSLFDRFKSRYYSLVNGQGEIPSFSAPIEQLSPTREFIAQFQEIFISELKTLGLQ